MIIEWSEELISISDGTAVAAQYDTEYAAAGSGYEFDRFKLWIFCMPWIGLKAKQLVTTASLFSSSLRWSLSSLLSLYIMYTLGKLTD
jgi:hypothetical protein